MEGADEAISPEEFDAIAKEGIGYPAEITSLSQNTVGRVTVNPHTRLPKDVALPNKLAGADLPGVYGHEIGHVIDQLAGEISTEGLTRELKTLYNVGNNPNRARGNPDMPAKMICP